VVDVPGHIDVPSVLACGAIGADVTVTVTLVREAEAHPVTFTASAKYIVFTLSGGVVKLVPVPTAVPPLAELYQL
jgi:hypothetical protein